VSRRFLPLLVLLGLTVPLAPARAADADEDAPTLLVRLKSIDEAIAAGVNLYGRVGNKADAEQFIDNAIKNQLGPKGLDGLDRKRPLGLYATIEPNVFASPVAVLVPVTSEKAFLDLLEHVHLKAEKGEGDLYRFQPPGSPLPAFIRFADQYAYIYATAAAAANKDKIPAPAKLFPAADKTLLTAVFRIDRVPELLKQQALSALQKGAGGDIGKQRPGESETEFAFRKAGVQHFIRQAKNFIQGGREIALRVDDQLGLAVTLTARPDTPLARDLADLGHAESRFAGLHGRDAALSLATTCHLPEDVSRALGQLMEEGFRKEGEKQTDPAQRDVIMAIGKALAPTFKAGHLDMGVVMHKAAGSDHTTLVGGIAIKDGEALDQVLRDGVGKLPEDRRGKIHLDARSAGSVKIHRLDEELFNSKDEKENEQRRKLFGKGPAYVAVAPDAVFFSMGPHGLDELTSALALKPGACPPFRLAISLPEFARMVAAEDQHYRDMTKNLGSVGVTIEGGKALRMRIDGFGAAVIGLMPAAGAKAQ
jgi:hypothetical protein